MATAVARAMVSEAPLLWLPANDTPAPGGDQDGGQACAGRERDRPADADGPDQGADRRTQQG